MVLKTNKNPELDDDYVDIRYRRLTPAIGQIMEICNRSTQVLLGELDGRTHRIDINDVVYIEWVDNRSCICTEKQVYTTPQALAQLEQALESRGFVRISKPMLVNVYKVRWISSGLHRKLTLEVSGGEKVVVSRHYRGNLLDAVYAMGKGESV